MTTDHHPILLCLGTNTDQAHHMRAAQKMLRQHLPDIRFTRILWTKPIGHPTPLYLNALATATTPLSPEALHALLKAVERRLGRTAADKPLHRVPIDIDLLQYGGQRLRPADWQRDFVRRLAAECPTIVPPQP